MPDIPNSKFDALSLTSGTKHLILTQQLLLSKLSYKIMSKKRSGRIVNISSGGWQYGVEKRQFITVFLKQRLKR